MGDSYEIVDVQNYYGAPAADGVYNGELINLTLMGAGSPYLRPVWADSYLSDAPRQAAWKITPGHGSRQFNA